jgi:hypothetical protein
MEVTSVCGVKEDLISDRAERENSSSNHFLRYSSHEAESTLLIAKKNERRGVAPEKSPACGPSLRFNAKISA